MVQHHFAVFASVRASSVEFAVQPHQQCGDGDTAGASPSCASSSSSMYDMPTKSCVQVPNVGLLSLDEPRSSRSPPPDSANATTTSTAIRASHGENEVDVSLPQPQPTPITAHALRLHNMVPRNEICTWAGANSSLYAIPFTRSAQVTLDFATHESDKPLKAPTREDANAQWPLNAIVDWSWGARLVQAFGSTALTTYCVNSRLSRDVEVYRSHLRYYGKRSAMETQEQEQSFEETDSEADSWTRADSR